ncbi:MAG: DJ-1/PfpI family protein [Bryobacteraceae bacterium]|nr:DJ-1/PfpI family protein [Bryobacteraceae bacterium]
MITHRALILLFNGVQIIDFAGPYEVLGQARDPAGEPLLAIATTSPGGTPITAAMGLRVTPDHALEAAPAAHLLVIPGGDLAPYFDNSALLDWIRRRSAQAAITLSVCNGALLLARAGLLDGLAATTWKPSLPDLARLAPRSLMVEARYVDSGRIVTSAGLSAGLDATLHCVARLCGMTVAEAAAERLEYRWRREDRADSQP